jgi:hypothetical protein
MPTHSLHPDLLLNGLADGCEQCRVEAEAPMDFLDEHAMADLWRRMVGFEYLNQEECRPRSENEARAMKRLWAAARVLRKARMTIRNLERLYDAGSRPVVLTASERELVVRLVEESKSGIHSMTPPTLADHVLAALGT